MKIILFLTVLCLFCTAVYLSYSEYRKEMDYTVSGKKVPKKK